MPSLAISVGPAANSSPLEFDTSDSSQKPTMSNTPEAVKLEFDFWEFVCCARCHLAFNSDLGVPQIPFWLTECGHIVCNNHLNADQSCAQCGERGIQLVPLQQNMDAPMSDWFRSVPYFMDSVANTAKFQQETMASLIRYYKEKSRKALDRLRSELEEKKALKKENEDLRHQNRQLQQHIDPREPSDAMNANGKRPMTASYRAGTNSSPSIVTPLGPNRLTIPPGQDAPNFSQQQGLDDSHNAVNTNNFQAQMQKPGSSRFVQQYAYNPPQTSQFQAPQLSHTQAAPVRQYQARQAQQRTMMPPPPPESNRAVRVQGGGNGFKPSASGRSLHPPDLQSNALSSRASPQRSDQNQPAARERRQMGPPPPPQASTQAPNRAAFTPLTTQSQAQSQESYPRIQTASFADLQPSKPSGRFSGSSSNNRFITPQAMNGSQRFVAPGLRAPSRTTNGSHTSSGRGGAQRMPFIAGAQDGFG